MRTLLKGLVYLLLFLGVITTAAVVWHEYPRKTPAPTQQTLFMDLSAPATNDTPGPGNFVTAGRLIHHQQCGRGLAGLAVAKDDLAVKSERVVAVTFPKGGSLSFDLMVPEPLLMDPKSKAVFSIEVQIGDSAPETIFQYNYRQDWIGLGLNFVRESWQVDYTFIDRFRHFEVDLAKFAGQKGALKFVAQTPAALSPEPDAPQKDRNPFSLFNYKKRSGAKFSEGADFLSARIWETGKRNENDFNIVFCVIDGMRADALSIYGYDKPTTPNIATLAKRSLVYDQAHAPSHATRNSITAILTGRPPSVLGLPLKRWDLTDTEATAFRQLTGQHELSVPSLPVYLNRKGYATGFVGSNPFVVPGNAIGADLGFSSSESMNQKRFDTEAIAQRGCEFIGQNKERPFLLYLHFNNGHGPLRPPKEFQTPFARQSEQGQPVWPAEYDGEMAYADSKVEQILQCLKANNVADNTLFVLSSDHGVTYETGHPKGHTQGLYESDTRVPLVVSFPDRIKQPARIDLPVSLLSLFPTILSLRGESDAFDQVDMWLDMFKSDVWPFANKEWATSPVLFFEGAGIQALLTDNTKLIVKDAPYKKLKGDVSTDAGRLMELYDLYQDPGETVNLVDSGTDEEQILLDTLWAHKMLQAKTRADQIRRLSSILGEPADTLYPDRFQEAFEFQLCAGDQDRLFLVTILPKHRIGSYHGPDFTIGDSLATDEKMKYLAMEFLVPARSSKGFGFTPYPPDDPFTIELFANGEIVPSVYIGKQMLPFNADPLQIGKARDYRMMTVDDAPVFDPAIDFGMFLWRWKSQKETTTQMGGQIKKALRSWGYVK